MSHVDNSREKLLKKYMSTWLPHQANLIYLVSKHSIIYGPSPGCHGTGPYRKQLTRIEKVKIQKDMDDAWIEISSKLGKPITSCRQLWSSIKCKYGKIMNLINTGTITKKAAMSHPETCRYLDGRLSFMDPYLYEMVDKRIPSTIHKSVNKIFGLEIKQTPKTSSVKPDNQLKKLFFTHAQVKALLKKRELEDNDNSEILHPCMDTKSLQTVIDNAVKYKLEDLLQNNSLSNDIVNNDDVNAVNVTSTPSEKLQNVHKSQSDLILISSDEENTPDCSNFGLQSELIIKNDDDVKIEHENDILTIEDDDGREENLVIDKNLINKTYKKVKSVNVLPIMPGASTILGDISDKESDAYIRNFLKELGEVMSLEMDINKKKKLKSRINELLKSILVNEEDGVLSLQRNVSL